MLFVCFLNKPFISVEAVHMLLRHISMGIQGDQTKTLVAGRVTIGEGEMSGILQPHHWML